MWREHFDLRRPCYETNTRESCEATVVSSRSLTFSYSTKRRRGILNSWYDIARRNQRPMTAIKEGEEKGSVHENITPGKATLIRRSLLVSAVLFIA